MKEANSKKADSNNGQPWNICDDFLDPLAELLCESGDDGTGTGPIYSSAGKHKYQYQSELRDAVKDGLFAATWLEVNVSVDVADRMRKKISDAIRKVERGSANQHADVSGVGRYLHALSAVLRKQSAEATISRDEIPPNEWSNHFSPAELENLYGKSWRTIKGWIAKGTIRARKYSSKDYQIHIADLPNGQEASRSK